MEDRDVPAALLTALAHGEFDRVRSLAAEDFTFATPRSGEIGLEAWLDVYADLRRGIPDLDFRVSEVERDGNRVRGVLNTTGTQTGTLDLPAFGVHQLAPTGVTIDLPPERFEMTVVDGKATSILSRPSEGGGLSGLVRQLGAGLMSRHALPTTLGERRA